MRSIQKFTVPLITAAFMPSLPEYTGSRSERPSLHTSSMGIPKQLLSAAFLATAVASDTCETLRSTTNVEVADVSEPAYTDRWYWNVECKALEPSCVLLPASTQDVVDIVNVLKDSGEPFGIKSGGHSPNLYFGSVDGGPLISTERLNEVTLDAQAGTVRVGPGNRWQEVIGALDGTGYTVPGGRVGHIGVGGLLLGSASSSNFPGADSPSLL